MKINMIPWFGINELPEEIEKYFTERDWPIHCGSCIVEVELEEENVVKSWLESLGYQFPETAIFRGWSHIAITGVDL